MPKQAGSFAIATIIYKFIMPARIAISLMAIPVVISTISKVKNGSNGSNGNTDATIGLMNSEGTNYDNKYGLYVNVMNNNINTNISS